MFFSFLSMYVFALRLALLNILRGRIRRGVYLFVRPLDYWRVFEFPVALEYLHPAAGEHILDIGSPKLFPMFVASRSHSHVYATDIYDDKGLTDTRFFTDATACNTLHVVINDVRGLPYPDHSFDKVFSISVLEHVFPATGGDVSAFKEIARVLRPSGIAVVTLPFSGHHYEEFRDEDIYERKKSHAGEKVFYQRHYSDESVHALVREAGSLEIVRREYICERFFHRKGRELCTFISEGNKLKRLSLAPFYSLFAFIFLKRSLQPIPSSEFMTVSLALRKKT